MAASTEHIPICDSCPMKDDYEKVLKDLDEQTLINAREQAVDVSYNDDHVKPRDLRERLVEDGMSVNLADLAANCLGNMQRRYCGTADYGWKNPGVKGDISFGVIHRT
jgi:hypothetical protein